MGDNSLISFNELKEKYRPLNTYLFRYLQRWHAHHVQFGLTPLDNAVSLQNKYLPELLSNIYKMLHFNPRAHGNCHFLCTLWVYMLMSFIFLVLSRGIQKQLPVLVYLDWYFIGLMQYLKSSIHWCYYLFGFIYIYGVKISIFSLDVRKKYCSVLWVH